MQIPVVSEWLARRRMRQELARIDGTKAVFATHDIDAPEFLVLPECVCFKRPTRQVAVPPKQVTVYPARLSRYQTSSLCR